MNDLPEIISAVMRKGFWDYQMANIVSRLRKMYGEKLFGRSKRRFLREFDAFSPLLYQKWIWTILIREKSKLQFE